MGRLFSAPGTPRHLCQQGMYLLHRRSRYPSYLLTQDSTTLSNLFFKVLVLPQRLKIAGNRERNLLAQVIHSRKGFCARARDFQSPGGL
ncbi:MAG: hypothetical protein KatS3mg022_0413 [Armatimonadota bacterium]|nr:MAG: hypothetical protein KatS3mg022_0413 [Armatimonadota bacterium]